jgi:hypothetical protein
MPCYENLSRGCKKLGFALDIVITHAQTPRVFAYVEAKDRDRLADYLNRYIRRMKAAGAGMLAIQTITPLFCPKDLIATSALPMVSLLNPLNKELVNTELAARKGQRAGGPHNAVFVVWEPTPRTLRAKKKRPQIEADAWPILSRLSRPVTSLAKGRAVRSPARPSIPGTHHRYGFVFRFFFANLAHDIHPMMQDPQPLSISEVNQITPIIENDASHPVECLQRARVRWIAQIEQPDKLRARISGRMNRG